MFDMKAYQAAWYQDNKAHVKKRNADHYKMNKTEMNARNNRYYADNKNKTAIRHKRWRDDNPGKMARIVRAWKDTVDGYLCNKLHRLKTRTAGVTDCDLTFDQLKRLYHKQGGKCVLTGRQLYIGGRGHSLDALSIDRKNQKKGYTIRNVRLVTWQANSARNAGTDAQLVAFCRDVLKYAKRRQKK